MRHKITYDPARDYYDVLSIDATATAEEVRQAYRRSVREAHPDLNPHRADWATEQLQRINEAYNVLRQPSLRQEYNRLRWPHRGAASPMESDRAYRSPFRTTTYDTNRPWWEQVANQAPPQYPFSEPAARSARRTADDPAPFWLRLAGWFRARGWRRLEKTWLSLVGLVRSPYGGILWTLAFILSVNVAVILYVFVAPSAEGGLLSWLRDDSAPSVTALPTASPIPDRLFMACGDPAVQISLPRAGDIVGESFSVYGTVNTAELWSYRIELSYLSDVFSVAAVPSGWVEVRAAPRNQSIPEPPVVDDLLTEQPVSLQGQRSGYYALRLTVTLRSGAVLGPCDVVVRH
jgi:hypothetical protein